MSGPAVIGLDLSLTCTGVALADGTSMTVQSPHLSGTDRLGSIRDRILAVLTVPRVPDLVVLEGYAFGARGRALFQIAELGGVIRMVLADVAAYDGRMGWAVAPPLTLKKYATGAPGSTKTAMVVAARERLDYRGLNDDEADAIWLRALGCELLGQPLVKLPLTHKAALQGVEMIRAPEGLAP